MLANQGIEYPEPPIFERGAEGRDSGHCPFPDVKDVRIPSRLLRKDVLLLPEASEVEVVRHYTRLSRMNYGVDIGMYPLGSCTMKYNPKVCEDCANLTGFRDIHPLFPLKFVQGALKVMYELEQSLKEISGMDAITLAPSAGAHGELTGLKIIRKALEKRGENRKKMLVPDTAHGTNPASCTLNGFDAYEVKSSEMGILTPETIRAVMDENTAGIMITNPNTLGLFETHIIEIAKIIHEKGGYVYGDGANLNAILGVVRPKDLGVDVIQFNLHKTFGTPHGGGGPGSGPVGVVQELERFLPVPRVIKKEDGTFDLSYDFPDSIGRVRSFYGQFGVMVKALAYIKGLGAKGLKKVAQMAVLNARYLATRLRNSYHLPYPYPCMHEVVFSDKRLAKLDVHTMDIAKRLIDHNFHPPTIYFPLIVSGALMIEPTETEDKATLDSFVDAMEAIAKEAQESPQTVRSAPHLTYISRPDEVEAGRKPSLTWKSP